MNYLKSISGEGNNGEKVGKDLSLLWEVDLSGSTSKQWLNDHAEEVRQVLAEKGALLVRNLEFISSKQVASCMKLVFGVDNLLPYTFRSTPRSEMKNNVYTATEYHCDMEIPLHNENAYTNNFPSLIGFVCILPASEGGQTPIADSARIYREIPAEIREEFERKQILYVRNYGVLDLPWQEVFNTDDKSDVHEYCRVNGIEAEWTEEDDLVTKQVCPASMTHPQTSEKVWFNQAHLFHVSSLRQRLDATALEAMQEYRLPRNAYFGDGSPIPTEYLDAIRQVYENNKILFNWQKSDLLLLDNRRYAHGRLPFKGERKVLTGMA